MTTPPPRRALEGWAGGLSILAGIIHGAVTQDHFEAWWGYGLFFVFAAFGQVLYGFMVWFDPFNPKAVGADSARFRRNFYAAGALANAAIILLYLVTRTVGIPFFGPEAGQVEPVGKVDALSKLVEIVLVVLLGVLVRRSMGLDASAAPPAG